MTAGKRCAEWLGRRLHGLLDGETAPAVLSLFRVGLALLVLLRSSELSQWLGGLDHHGWAPPELASAQGPLEPRLLSPLVPLPALPAALSFWLGRLRTALAVLLLLGVRTRAVALLLFVLGYGLMAQDRYQYLHHLHLLWTSCLWLALCQSSSRWSLERGRGRGRGDDVQLRWSLQLLRAQALILYGAAALAKLNAPWLSGRALAQLAELRLVHGPTYSSAVAALGVQGTAIAVAAAELSLVLLLPSRRGRWAGLLLALALHAGLESSMMLSTFGAQMGLYLMLFLPWRRGRDNLCAGPAQLDVARVV